MKATAQENQFLVLIVDDELFTRLILRNFLEREGYQIVEAQNGREALTLFNQLHPDIVLLDAVMSDMDGFECCTQLQTLDSHKHTPVLMITGLEDQESVDRAFAVGAMDYVTKPIHWPVLRQRVKRLIQQSQLQQQLEAVNLELQRLATIDGLTQVANRRRFEEYSNQQWQQMKREQRPLSMIICDVDFFKLYNDTYGHRVGDRCLQEIAQVIKNIVKCPGYLVARYGGEEFAVILPNTDTQGATDVAEKICHAVRTLAIPHQNSQVSPYVTISAGFTTEIPQPDSDLEQMIAAADRALYQAKTAGRDRFQQNNFTTQK
ncbi:response regulator [Nostoc sp. WHI]|uniref:response regulator n=1 Tax=Nostoc sp. WHI TaxID=2650611 RepID=UPI0018C4ABA9|nr:PleD family two-component system response regulator [Nostoc sp. WHI]MBG1268065.1 PleD family two-component system response regulator [Nostoc sp. WHI]